MKDSACFCKTFAKRLTLGGLKDSSEGESEIFTSKKQKLMKD